MADIGKAVSSLSKEDCVLLLAHEPDYADVSSTYNISAQFSGHSHGGQVRIPLIGPVIKHELSKKYVSRLYHIGKSQMSVYVNQGIGTTQVPFRLFCRPEITVFYLSS